MLPRLTFKTWTCEDGTTGTADEHCADPNGTSLRLAPGEYSPLFEYWDVLRIDAGWCYKVEFVVPGKVCALLATVAAGDGW